MQLSAFPATSLRNAEKAPRAPKPLFGRATSTRAPPAKEAKRKGLEATPATRSRKAIRAPTAARPPPLGLGRDATRGAAAGRGVEAEDDGDLARPARPSR